MTEGIAPGAASPLGAQVQVAGTNFALLSPRATRVELLLFAGPISPVPARVIELAPETHFSHGVWHVWVEGVGAGQHFNWTCDGPRNSARQGCHFDPCDDLLDPYSRQVSAALWDRPVAEAGTIERHRRMRSVVCEDEDFDWGDDQPLYIPLEDTVLYELHVDGFTRHPSSNVRHPGTFAGLIEKIPYLQALGITHVELMPVFAFDEQCIPEGTRARGLRNYWGYSTHSFFALHDAYAAQPGAVRDEFRQLVKALHAAGLGVVLDVVFNHTAEGGPDGPTMNFRGIGNEFYYHLLEQDKREYRDYTGCGNTVNANHPDVQRFILDCLQFWVRDMHVDGFRFDIAAALTRDEAGVPRDNAPLVWAIELDPALANTHLLAECWDAAGLYQVGSFPGRRWTEWNGRYRDCVRRFMRGDEGTLGELAERLAGSGDMYSAGGRSPLTSINFVTCHDGFTLNDLLCYEQKHNEANGEDNRDGASHNLSCNYGVEGETDDPQINRLRRRQAKNFIALLMLSQGVPMLLAGDEMLRTQGGSNNPWCQANEINWVDWRLAERHAGMVRFVQQCIALRKRHASLRRTRFLTGKAGTNGEMADVRWHGRRLDQPPWEDPGARVLAFTLAAVRPEEAHLHVMINMSAQALALPIPRIRRCRWHRAVDTAQAPPHDIHVPGEQPVIDAGEYVLHSRALVVLEGVRAPLS